MYASASLLVQALMGLPFAVRILVVNPGPALRTVVSPDFGFQPYTYLWKTAIADRRLLQRYLRNHIVLGTPGSLVDLASQLQSQGRRDSIRPLGVITCSEKLTAEARRYLNSRFGCGVYDLYAASEVIAPLAAECQYHTGLHTYPETAVVELLRHGKRVPDGWEGEVVVTDLCNYVQPVVRYALGDVAISRHVSCACGASGLTITDIVGREVHRFRVGGGEHIQVRQITESFVRRGCRWIRAIQVGLNVIDVLYHLPEGGAQAVQEALSVLSVHLDRGVRISFGPRPLDHECLWYSSDGLDGLTSVRGGDLG